MWEKHLVVASCTLPPGDPTSNSGMCPSQEQDQQPLGLQPTINSLSHTSQGENKDNFDSFNLDGYCCIGSCHYFSSDNPRQQLPTFFGTRGQFRGRQFFHVLGWGGGFGMIQAHYIEAHLPLRGLVPTKPRPLLVCSLELGDPWSKGKEVRSLTKWLGISCFKNSCGGLTCVSQFVGAISCNHKSAGLIPGQGTCPGCGSYPG